MKSFRRVGGILLAMLIVAAVVLGFWEVQRQSAIRLITAEVLAAKATAESAQVKEINPKELEAQYQDANNLSALLDHVRKEAADIDARDRALEHVEVQIAKEIDPKGQVVAAERHTERIWREGDKKYRQTLDYIDLVKGKPKKGATDRPRPDTGKINEIFPFQRSAAEDDYRYTFAGVEQIRKQWTIKIAFEPTKRPTGRFRGESWVNPVTFAPVRLFATLAEKKPFLDQLSMLIDYGIVESGQVQVVSTVIDGSGGFAMLQKHIRSEIAFDRYREHAAVEKLQKQSNDP